MLKTIENQTIGFWCVLSFSCHPIATLLLNTNMDAILFENISHSPLNWSALCSAISSQIIGCCHCHTLITCHKTDFVCYFIFLQTQTHTRSALPLWQSRPSSSPVYFGLRTAIPNSSKICFVHGPIFTFMQPAANIKSPLEHWNSAYFWLPLFLLQRCNRIAFWKCHRVCHLLNGKPKCRQHLLVWSRFNAA